MILCHPNEEGSARARDKCAKMEKDIYIYSVKWSPSKHAREQKREKSINYKSKHSCMNVQTRERG